MYYQPELDYFIKVLEKMHIPTRIVRPDMSPGLDMDLGLRHFFGLDEEQNEVLKKSFALARPNTIYRMTDHLRCTYYFLLLPGKDAPEALLTGPYVTSEITREFLLEVAETFDVPASRIGLLEDCFVAVPVLPDETALITMFSVLGETLWGSSSAFEIVDVEQKLFSTPAPLHPPKEEDDPDDIILRMKVMETRYAYENDLMSMVSQGKYHRAELLMSSFSDLIFEQRMPDRLRNLKNYAIICNTLMRKAAEQGGVHPVYLDSTSSHFAHSIESITSPKRVRTLISDMVLSYCRLVRSHATDSYAPPIQKALVYIEANLSGDLSLQTLARAQNISAGYLSSLFHREMGKTLTEYVTLQRMEAAVELLHTTRLQVQTVAQRCGISDVNYFSKLFKKHTGMSPVQYREHMKTNGPKK